MREPGSLIGRLAAFCCDHAPIIAALAVVQGAIVSTYAIRHFAMSTDTSALISPRLEWRVREADLNALFPPARSAIVVVVDGKTPELGESAAAALAQSLAARRNEFNAVRRPDAGPFWSHNRLLYASTAQVQKAMADLIKAEPFLGPMAADPSLRGLMRTLSAITQGVTIGQATLAELREPISKLADALQDLRTGGAHFFSWRALIGGGDPDPKELRHLILVDPKLEYSRLQPGNASIEAIRTAAHGLHLDAEHGVRIRLTGNVPLQDEEFSTLAERASLIAALSIGAIVLMLWLAVRSARLIIAILVTTLLGLATASAVGLAVFHRFNVISVAFIPLFVGLGIDFGIQFTVRYRAERSAGRSLPRDALAATGRAMGRSLTLAATAIAVGFLAFAPTDYYGVSQLGLVAGFGMFIALACNLTLLPALIALLRPPADPPRSGGYGLVVIDEFILNRRRLVLGISIAAAALSAALLPLLHFDFNPIHLRNRNSESVATLFDLIKDPDQSTDTLEVIRPNLAAADALAAAVGRIAEVSSARTLSSFIPVDQQQKTAIIADAANLLDLALNPLAVAPLPSDAELIDSLRTTAADLRQAANGGGPAAGDARRLGQELVLLADQSPAGRAAATQMLIPGFAMLLGQIRDSLQPQPIDLGSLPSDLVRDWRTPDGRARVSIVPRGDSNDNRVLDQFVAAVKAKVPDVTGTALAIQAAGEAVVGAFVEAGVLSFLGITALLWLALRRVRDVAITMAPIVLTGLLTMGSCVVIGQPLNFANIIALPLLFGIGVAFHIYFVMSWRAGGSHLLTSSLARAVFFSALATATGFGSLWASSHPGMASMGKLLMISLIWTLVSALLFQPALMGAPPVKTA